LKGNRETGTREEGTLTSQMLWAENYFVVGKSGDDEGRAVGVTEGGGNEGIGEIAKEETGRRT